MPYLTNLSPPPGAGHGSSSTMVGSSAKSGGRRSADRCRAARTFRPAACRRAGEGAAGRRQLRLTRQNIPLPGLRNQKGGPAMGRGFTRDAALAVLLWRSMDECAPPPSAPVRFRRSAPRVRMTTGQPHRLERSARRLSHEAQRKPLARTERLPALFRSAHRSFDSRA